MRITIITDTWEPQANGVVSVIAALSRKLREREYDVSLIEPGQCVSLPLRHSTDVQLAFFPGRRVSAKLAKLRPDAIHIMTEGPIAWAARRFCLRHGIPFTTSYHTNLPLYAEKFAGRFFSGLTWAYERRFHKPSRKVFVATDALRELLSRKGFENLSVVPLGVDTDFFVRRSVEPIERIKKPVFAYFGRVAPEKNVEEFLNLRLPGTKIVIGDGSDRARLEKKHPEVVWTGLKKGAELVEWLSRADVLVAPSTTETFGLSMLEALSCGIPVVAHDVMGPREIVQPGAGFLGDDLAALAEKALSLSPERCRETALLHSWDRAADSFVGHLAFITHLGAGPG